MAPTPTPTIPAPPAPGDLSTLTGIPPAEPPQRLIDAIESSRGAGTPGALDAALASMGVGGTSPWFWLAVVLVAIIGISVLGKLGLSVWAARERHRDAETRLRRLAKEEKNAETYALREARQQAKTVTAADPVNLDEER